MTTTFELSADFPPKKRTGMRAITNDRQLNITACYLYGKTRAISCKVYGTFIRRGPSSGFSRSLLITLLADVHVFSGRHWWGPY